MIKVKELIKSHYLKTKKLLDKAFKKQINNNLKIKRKKEKELLLFNTKKLIER